MHPVKDLIHKKRDGATLDSGEIAAFVAGISDNSITDAQIAAFAMATWFRGMSVEEQMALTLAMRDSGRVLQWPGLDGPVLDKHSTGGVGDQVSLILGPVIASCGAYVPMISGRGLGHTGGTLDKLESIPGFGASPGIERFQRLVRQHGLAIVGQSDELVPADRRMYAVRDVTATVSSPPLMISSILSKKLAEGLDGLVMDIKFGSGAVITDLEAAQHLGEEICRVSGSGGVPCRALVTNMDQPLAGSAGNALEVLEVVRFLRGDARNERVDQLRTMLATLRSVRDGKETVFGGIQVHGDLLHPRVARPRARLEHLADLFHKAREPRLVGGEHFHLPVGLADIGREALQHSQAFAPLGEQALALGAPARLDRGELARLGLRGLFQAARVPRARCGARRSTGRRRATHNPGSKAGARSRRGLRTRGRRAIHGARRPGRRTWAALLAPGTALRWLDSTGLPIGVPIPVPVRQASAGLTHGAMVAAWRDGITGAMELGSNPARLFGREPVQRWLEANRRTPVAAVVDGTFAEVDRFLGRVHAQDDRTMLVLRRAAG